MNDYREVYGYLSQPFLNTINEQGKIDRGLIKVIFEKIDGKFSLINSIDEFDAREEIFLLDGFEGLKSRSQQNLIKINAVLNTNQDHEGQTKYVTFKNLINNINKTDICSFIECQVPDALHLGISLPSAPHTKIFYLVDDGYAYGPFSLDRLTGMNLEDNECDGQLKPLSGKSNGFPSLKVGQLFKFDFNEIKDKLDSCVFKKEGVYYLTEPKLLLKLKKESIEFFTQQNIVEVFQGMLTKRVIQKTAVTAIKKELNAYNLGTLTREAIVSVVDSAASSNEDWRDCLFDIIEKDDVGKLLIENAVEQHQDKYEKKWLERTKAGNIELVNESENKKAELEGLQQEITNKNRELVQVELDIEQKFKKLEEESGFDEELQQKHMAADAELKQKRAELEELNKQYSDIKNLDELHDKLKDLRTDIKGEQRREIALEDTIAKLKKDIEKEDSVLQSRLREMVPYVSSIIQAPIPSKRSKTELSSQERIHLETDINAKLASDIINGICTQFGKNHDRDYSSALIASILVAHYQNFLVIFSGPPGLGKTSFVRILSKIINLGDRFKEVAVGRAWTSEREFIGFYNSLTDNFSPAPSGLYQYFKGIEYDKPDSTAPKTILLDEANLSPMEHYASVLLNVSDDESEKKISIGKESIQLPSDLRIIGTVNHDMTTEPLSARLLDRSPVIPFDVGFDLDEVDFQDIECELNYSSKVFSELFSNSSKLLDASISDDVVQNIVLILQDNRPDFGVPFVISKRKQANVNRYIAVLAPILEASCGLNFERALTLAVDYATLYFLLPPITGNGAGIELRLKELSSVLNDSNLDKSLSKLDDMITRGKYHLDTFNFFNY